MRKLISLAIILLSVVSAPFAAKAQFRYGPAVGVTLNDLVFNQELVDVSQQAGYMAGIQGEMIFPGIGIGIDLGLLYNQQGAMVKLGQKNVWASDGYGNERAYIHNIKIPLYLKLKYNRLNGFEEKIAPIVFGGPEFNIQVAHGKCEAFKYSGGDLGLTAGVGCELFRRWQITGSYTWGMTYALKTKLLDDYSAQSRQWTVKVAYFF